MPPNLWGMSLFAIVSGTIIAAVFAIVYGMFERRAAKPEYLREAQAESSDRTLSLWYIAGGLLTAMVSLCLLVVFGSVGAPIPAFACIVSGAVGLAFVLFGLIR